MRNFGQRKLKNLTVDSASRNKNFEEKKWNKKIHAREISTETGLLYLLMIMTDLCRSWSWRIAYNGSAVVVWNFVDRAWGCTFLRSLPQIYSIVIVYWGVKIGPAKYNNQCRTPLFQHSIFYFENIYSWNECFPNSKNGSAKRDLQRMKYRNGGQICRARKTIFSWIITDASRYE